MINSYYRILYRSTGDFIKCETGIRIKHLPTQCYLAVVEDKGEAKVEPKVDAEVEVEIEDDFKDEIEDEVKGKVEDKVEEVLNIERDEYST